MMDSVRLFLRNLIKYVLYIAVFAQIVSGTVYLVCNFTEYIVYPETKEMVHVARGLLFDEYTGVLYPLFIRGCLGVQSLLGIGYYLVAHLLQLVLVTIAVFYFVRTFFEGKKAWIATAYIVSFPMIMQTILMVSPFAFKAAFGFVIIGAMIRLFKNNGNFLTWIWLLLAYVLAAFNVTDDLYMWILPIGIFGVAYFFKNRKSLHIAKRVCLLVIIAVIFVVTFGALNSVAQAGNRGRMQRTVSSVLFQRTLWPELRVKFGFLPMDIRYHIDPDVAMASDASAENIIYVIGPRVDREVGFEKANELYMESFMNQMAYNKRAVFGAVLDDCTGYLFTPYSMLKYMAGEEGSAFSTLYGMISAKSPQMTYHYFSVGFVSMFVLIFAGVLRVVRKKLLTKKACIKQFLFFLGILLYQGIWYSIANVQGVDYRYGLFNIAVFAVFALGGDLFAEKTDKEKCSKRKVVLNTKKCLLAAGGVFAFFVLIFVCMVWKKDYKESELLEGKKIVCLGDSIWGLVTDDTGIAAMVEKMTGATVVNYAIPGTTATETKATPMEEQLSSLSLMQIVKALESGENSGFVESRVFEEAEYLIIAYGLNDYFKGLTIASDDETDINTYEGALTYAVEFFKENYPNLQIVLIGQTYCQFYSYGIVEKDSDTHDFGGGVGMDYVKAVEAVADKYGLIFINQYENLPMNEWNGKLYLEDATHLNKKGRTGYAKAVSEFILDDYKERNAR